MGWADYRRVLSVIRFQSQGLARLQRHDRIESEAQERVYLDAFVRGWRSMRDADPETRQRLCRRYGLSLPDLESAVRGYIERVKQARAGRDFDAYQTAVAEREKRIADHALENEKSRIMGKMRKQKK